MALLARRNGLPRAVGALLLIGVLLRLWHFAGGRSLWLDEAMVALNIIHLSPTELLGPLVFDQLAPAGWLLLEKACLHLWDDFDYSLRLPSLVAGIAALFLFHRFLKYGMDEWETLAGVAMMAALPVFIQYSSMVKPYIFDVLFAIALLFSALVLLRDKGNRLRCTALYGAIGIVCIPLSFGGTLVMAGTGTLLFAASIIRKDYAWSMRLAAVGIVWGLLFGTIYSLVYAQNADTITNMTGLYWTDTFAPVPTSLHDAMWYYRTATVNIHFLMSNINVQLIAVIWIYGIVRMAGREPWLAALVVCPIMATLVASMLGLYAFNTRFILGLAPTLIVGVACGVGGIVTRFGHRPIAALAMLALLGLTPLKQVAMAASQVPPFPMEEIKTNLAYLKRHYRQGDELILHQWAERAFVLYAERFGLSDMDYDVTSNFRLDQSCVYDDVRTIREKKHAWLLFYHVVGGDRAGLNFFERALRHTGTLKLVRAEPGAKLYEYTARDGAEALQLPPSAAICSRPRIDQDFLERVVKRARTVLAEEKSPGRQ